MNHTGVAGRAYQAIRKLSLPDQMFIARKLGAVMPLVEGMTAADNVGKDKTLLTLLLLGNLADDVAADVTRKALGVVTTQDSTGQWAVLAAPNGTVMFEDVGVKDVLDLTSKIIEENLGDFFRTALGNLQGLAQEPRSNS